MNWLNDLCTTWEASRPNTIFVIVSDHGEEHGERGSWGHGHTLTPEQLWVPWIVWGAGIEASRVATRVGLEDLAPTLAALAGTSFGPFDGVDRSPALRRAGGDGGDPGARLASTSRRVTVLTKTELGGGSSLWAQGGVAAALGRDPHDARLKHRRLGRVHVTGDGDLAGRSVRNRGGNPQRFGPHRRLVFGQPSHVVKLPLADLDAFDLHIKNALARVGERCFCEV